MNNSTILKRIGAYLIDFLVITLISMMITKISFINPKYDEYTKVSTKYNEMLNDYYDKKIEINEFNKQVSEISYDMNKSGYVYIISDIVVIILYFGVFNYVSQGRTLGKRALGLQIVSNKDKPLKIYNYFIRCIILNGIIMDIVTLIAINFNRNTYYDIYSIGSNINMFLQVVIFLSIMFTVNGRGIHDIIAGTKVINTKIINKEIKDEKEKQAKENIIEEAKNEIIKPDKKVKTIKKGKEKKDE